MVKRKGQTSIESKIVYVSSLIQKQQQISIAIIKNGEKIQTLYRVKLPKSIALLPPRRAVVCTCKKDLELSTE